MPSLLTFADIIELKLLRGGMRTVFFLKNGSLASVGNGPSDPTLALPTGFWGDDGVLLDIEADLRALASSITVPGHEPAILALELDGRATPFRVQAADRPNGNAKIIFVLDGLDPWAPPSRGFDPSLGHEWFDQRRARSRARFEAAALSQALDPASPDDAGPAETPRL